jgi:hypothetical protein
MLHAQKWEKGFESYDLRFKLKHEHEILCIRGLLLFYLWNLCVLIYIYIYVGSTWFIYSSYMLCFFMKGLYRAVHTSYNFFYMIHLQFIHVLLKPDTWPIPPWFYLTWSWNANGFEPTWHSHTGPHVKDNGTGPHSLSSTTQVHKTVTGPVFFPEKPDRLTEKCIFWSGWGTGNRPVWLTGRTGNTGYSGKSVGSQWIRTPWHHHLNCSTMDELGAQGARGGATVQGNAWRVAGTCAWNQASKSQEANTPK